MASRENKAGQSKTANTEFGDKPRSKYAKVSQKNAAQIEPLKDTNNGKPMYESDQQKMAQILSNQYESVFSTPKYGPRHFDFNTLHSFIVCFAV